MLVFFVCMNKLLWTYLRPMKSCKMSSFKKHLRELDVDLQLTCQKQDLGKMKAKFIDMLYQAKEEEVVIRKFICAYFTLSYSHGL